ncbi:CheR family methyltransferase [Pacificimonas sp. ICDLI1SI03]
MTVPPASFPVFEQVLRRNAGLKFSPEKSYLLTARLSDIMAREGCATLDALAERLVSAPHRHVLERHVVEAMLNHESFFFRDRTPFTELEATVYPGLRGARAARRHLSIWSAACAGGQEPYSLAMQLIEQQADWQGWRIDLLASDISHAAVMRAEKGEYSQFEVQRGLSIHRLLRHFTQDADKWIVSKEVRDSIRFERRSLLQPPPVAPGRTGKFDIIFARNVLMYLAAEEKAQAIQMLRRALADDGVLIIGAAETLFGYADLFVQHPACRGFYAPVLGDAPSAVEIQPSGEFNEKERAEAAFLRAPPATH